MHMGYTVVDATDVEARGGVFRPLRGALGVTAFGINQEEWPADTDRYPEHTEEKSGQEEVYVILAGSGRMTVGGDEVELVPGRYVLVEPGTARKVWPGPDGIKLVCVGAQPGGYEPSGPQ
jgi:mannose-6-phosphate isomerase-like protein (cupin superfamily)